MHVGAIFCWSVAGTLGPWPVPALPARRWSHAMPVSNPWIKIQNPWGESELIRILEDLKVYIFNN